MAKKLTDAVREDILRRLTEGQSLRSACAVNGVTAGCWCNNVAVDTELAERYARARERGIDAQAEEMHDLECRVIGGDLDPNAFRAAMDARKWRLAKQMPQKYGDKQHIEQNTTVKGAVAVTDVPEAYAEMLRDLGVNI